MPSLAIKPRERMRQVLVVAIGAALLLALLTPLILSRFRSGSFTNPLASSVKTTSENAPTVAVSRGSIKKVLLLDGELRAVRSRMIYSNTPEEAKIVYLPPEGTVLKAGERIAELDAGTVLTKIKDNEEKIVAAENEIVRLRAQHESQLRDLEVELSKLWLTHEQAKLKAKIPAEVLARREYQEAQLALEKSKTEYDNHLAKIEQKKKEQAAELQVKTIEKDKLQVQLDRAKSNLDGMRIKAPADGMVIYNEHYNERRKMQVGDMVWGGWPIVRLPDMTEMEVLTLVNEVDGPKLSIGAKAEIKLDSYPDTVITGAVKEISQTAVKAGWMSKAKIFRVIVSLDRTATEIMKPGMSAQVSVITGETPQHLLVPRGAVKFEGDTATVARPEANNTARQIAVNILAADGVNYAVAGNGALKEGDKILIR
ncbi:MAG TPA: efflux RND transporter periplasmic adaptor subunit [Blastocatellia bacterium]|nr:efflux RND transporter periplasmic adaptor subunit [Blastocatellia bacterium]HMV87901.1 efflux RND transporter periplasmic adaptor subunit [Blastocatellia bacterium]HMX26564.1 efflux RND transporter periplasmic adaptor subunit [Blastocatellia bacterium]HMY77063.1 efflux RND transporter periplasmic adaptor subunit [Blastocatellia bacterium]HNG34186.1 efflux RND transporter periplasmic adaptor subunit [Blastocatellia bacterium]